MPYQRTEIQRPKGINKDLSPYELPPEVWSDGSNVDFRRNRTNKSLGYSNIFELQDTVAKPMSILYFTDNTSTFWIYGDETSLYKTDGEVATDVSAYPYSSTRDSSWIGINFNSVPIMNNPNDVPQVLLPEVYLPAPDTYAYDTFQDLPFWGVQAADSVTPPEDYLWGEASRCRVIRPYKNYLFALDCYDENTTRYPSMVRWSSPAQLGDVPPSWDPDSPSEQAGLYTLADTPGKICDGLTLGDYFVIYKTDSVWLVQFIGGDFNFSFRKLFGDDAGALSSECMAEFEGKHFVLSPTGAYVHNASTKQEVMDPWVKDEFFLNADPTLIQNTKVVADHNNQEIWVYYTTKNSSTGWCDKALIWNWTLGEWTIRDLTGISYIAEGVVSVTAAVNDWDEQTATWDGIQGSKWASGSTGPFNPVEEGLVVGDYVNDLLYVMDSSVDQLGSPLTGRVKRIGIDFNNDYDFKYVSRVIPHVIGTDIVYISMFVEDTQSGSPTKFGPYAFMPGQDQDIDCHVTGRYIGIEFQCDGLFNLTGYTLVWEPTGNQ